MALSYVSTQGTITIPSAPATWQVAPSNSGIATNGIVVLVGEADSGADFTSEPDITLNYFAPTQFAAVQSKYISGHLVDAFREVINSANDPNITGAPSSVYLIKTNKGYNASGAFANFGGGLSALAQGTLGNLISFSVTQKVAQTQPSFSAAYTAVQATDTEITDFSANGRTPYSISTGVEGNPATPDLAAVAFANSAFSFSQDIMVNGGTSHYPSVVGGTLAVAVSNNQITISITGQNWLVTPTAGQTLVINHLTDATIAGVGNANDGSYIVLSATAQTIVALKVKTSTGAIPAANSTIAVSPVASTATAFDTFDQLTFSAVRGLKRFDQTGLTTWSGTVAGSYFVLALTTLGQVWAKTPKVGDYVKFMRGTSFYWFQVISATTNSMTLQQVAPTPTVSAISTFASEAVGTNTLEVLRPNINGIGQSLIAYRDPTSTATRFYNSLGVPAVISSTGGIAVSSSEQSVSVAVQRSSTNTNELWTAGGNVALTIGKDTSTVNSITIDASDNLHLGTDYTINLSTFNTIGNLAAYINTLPLYHAYATPVFQQLNPATALDQITPSSAGAEDDVSASNQGITGAMPCRIKTDSYSLISAINQSAVVYFSSPTSATSGLPEPSTPVFLAGGTKGGTANSDVIAALAAAGLFDANFIVTLFSTDSATDIVTGDTDSTSTYDIASVNAALSSHVLQYSEYSMGRPRQGFSSFRGSYVNSKNSAATTSDFRVACNFLDVKTLGANGLQWFQPWMGSVVAAGTQAAAFYRPIFNKGLNISGVRSNAGDFLPSDKGATTDALNNGLMVIRQRSDGSFVFASDNTTYGADQNFVYNSIQAVYVADLVAQTTSQRMEKAFVGQSFADVTPNVAMAFFRNIMASLKTLKLITSSSDAVSGYKNVIITINAPVMYVSAEIKLSTGVYFVPIVFQLTQVQGQATA